MDLSNELNSRIQLLPEHLIDQIKAGEVVERPANVLKELLENSIDAGSTEIKVTLENNGLDLIAIEDNGDGMSFGEIPYAFCRHATSKISSFEDIYRLNTFGFRGEALASISSVARVSCHSAPKESPEEGGKLLIHGAQTIEHSLYKPSKGGTAIFVKDLFFNTPVRLKFVKSKVSEKNALRRILNAFLITNPEVKFTISIDDNEKEIYSAVSIDQRVKRLEKVISTKREKRELIQSTFTYMQNQVNVFASKTANKGNTGKHHYLFVNNRLFTDKKIHQIIIRNMEKYWPLMMTGHYIIELNVPENEIDVNVHPNKTLIKFLKANEVFSIVSAAIKKLIEENPNENEIHSSEGEFSFEGENTNLNSILNSAVWNDDNHSNLLSKLSSESSFGQSEMFTSQAEQTFLNIGSNIFVIEDTKIGVHVVNMECAITYLLEKVSKMAEPEMTPLLISEPVSFSKINNEEEVLNRLVGLGFESDRIDDSTIVIRTSPTLLESYDFKEIYIALFQNGAKVEGADFENVITTNSNLIDLLRDHDLITLKKNHIAKILRPNKLKKMFK